MYVHIDLIIIDDNTMILDDVIYHRNETNRI